MKNNYQPLSTESLGQLNTGIIMETIQAHGPITRPEILRRTGLSFSTVLRVTEKLIQSGLVIEAGLEASTGGRRSTRLKLNDEDKVVIGVDMGGTKIFSGLIGLSGNILTKLKVDVDKSSPQSSLDQLYEMISQLVLKTKELNVDLIGIGVGVPGITDTEMGKILLSPSLKWRELPLKSMLSERFQLPVVIENDVNMMALGEYGYGVGRKIRNMVLIAYGTGVGSGIIIDGSLYRGSTFSAGEIGHMVPGRNFLHKNYEYSFGALEVVSSGTGIAQRGSEYIEKTSQIHPEGLTTKDIFDYARKGESWALQMVDEVIDYITISVANTVVLLDPEAIIFSGGIFNSADLLLDPIKERLKGLIPMQPKILLSELGPQAAIMGAAHQVLSLVAGSQKINN
jgi:glucokinase-like ROK family protein